MTVNRCTDTARKSKAALKKAEKAGDVLCAAVAKWVKTLGGTPVVIGGISVRADRKFRFEVIVRVTGSRPNFKLYELP